MSDSSTLWGEEYFAALEEEGGAAWVERVDGAIDGLLPGPSVLALLHPQWLRPHLSAPQVASLLGKTQFPESVRRAGEGCQAIRLWGYRCPILDPDRPAGDHLFPRSAGGVTTPANYLALCRRHNSVKSDDVHLYPYYEDPPRWVYQSLQQRRGAVVVAMRR